MGEQVPEPAAFVGPKRAAKPAPGWYTDGNHDIRRWWDGAGWTDIFEPPSVQSRSGVAEANVDDNVALLGYGFGILVPVIGLLVGLALIIRGHSQSIGVIVLSAISGLIWVWLVLGLL